jgi:hypothetical protein
MTSLLLRGSSKKFRVDAVKLPSSRRGIGAMASAGFRHGESTGAIVTIAEYLAATALIERGRLPAQRGSFATIRLISRGETSQG